MISLQTPITSLPRLQPHIAKKFGQLQLVTLQDALLYFPFRHEDFRHQTTIDQLAAGQDVTIHATITALQSRRAWHRRGTTITNATVIDDSGAKIHAIWFNLPFLAKSLHVGDHLFLSGTVTEKNQRLQLHNPVYEKPTATPLHERLIPVYRTTEGLSQRQIRLVMKQAIEVAEMLTDPISANQLHSLRMMSLAEALRQIHFPESPELAHQAVERLKFDELLGWHLRVLASVAATHQGQAPAIPFREIEVRSFVQQLPFELTNDQRIAAWQILQDVAQPKPMSRLIQGDVGSGKTVVATLVAYNVALHQRQVAFVAPTVVLAEQHWGTASRLLAGRGVSLALLTGQAAKVMDADGQPRDVTRAEVLRRVADGSIGLLIGTHAILQPTVVFPDLSLVIIDEQQRFGVDQRQALLTARTETPHFLSLTATPIPRSLALWLSGVLSVSSIRQKPAGRPPITTTIIGPNTRSVIDQAITKTVARHEQVYVITPLIEESDTLGVRAALTEHRRLTEAFPHTTVGVVHGAMPADERVQVLEKFRRQEIMVLVSTTVIEVGIDVPNATLMVIEGAERFGVSQLHQLRGRVGRGTAPSTCFFVTDQTSPTVQQRLAKVAATSDGLAVAELDYNERGAGDLYGQRQSGLPTWQLASLTDQHLFERVQQFAAALEPDEQHQLRQRLSSHHPAQAFHRE
ncbi:MAG: ATP-dependent DNA helicase RecG [Candidatus Kerfeldbacteria bacterium]|nr:ATP-dependent DNA helicase RecG [Candidatus Kerfeldbacteria bacterium]